MKNRLAIQEIIDNAKNILVIQAGGIGDCVMSTPSLRALRKKYPLATINLMVIPRCANLFERCPHINNLIVFDPGRFKNWRSILNIGNAIELKKILKSQRDKNYDLAINLFKLGTTTGALRMAALMKLINVKCLIGRKNIKAGFFYDIKVAEEGHEVLSQLSVVRAIGCDVEDKSLELWISDEDMEFADNFLKENGVRDGDLIFSINPGTAKLHKRWSKERFVEIADWLIDKYGGRLLITGSQNEMWLAEEIKSKMKRDAIISSGKTTLNQLAVLLKKSKLFITNDSGPMHIASVVVTPLIAIFGPTNPDFVGPWNCNGNTVVVAPDIKCHPCDKEKCDTLECYEIITTEMVKSQIKRLFP